MRPRIFAMVSSREALKYTECALRSFFAHTPLDTHDEFILIDNDSSCPIKNIKKSFPRIRVIQNGTLMSFASNVNKAMWRARERKADLFFLNNDLFFTPGWIHPMMRDNGSITVPASNLVVPVASRELVISGPINLEDFRGKERIFLKLLAERQKSKHGYKVAQSFEYFCVRIPYEVFNVVGEFDERFKPIGWEDTDYAVRATLKGFRHYYALDSYVLHFLGKSSWRKDEGPDEHFANEEKRRARRKVFEDKWGEKIAKVFSDQDEASQAWLREQEEKAINQKHAEIIRELAPKSTITFQDLE